MLQMHDEQGHILIRCRVNCGERPSFHTRVKHGRRARLHICNPHFVSYAVCTTLVKSPELGLGMPQPKVPGTYRQ